MENWGALDKGVKGVSLQFYKNQGIWVDKETVTYWLHLHCLLLAIDSKQCLWINSAILLKLLEAVNLRHKKLIKAILWICVQNFTKQSKHQTHRVVQVVIQQPFIPFVACATPRHPSNLITVEDLQVAISHFEALHICQKEIHGIDVTTNSCVHGRWQSLSLIQIPSMNCLFEIQWGNPVPYSWCKILISSALIRSHIMLYICITLHKVVLRTIRFQPTRRNHNLHKNLKKDQKGRHSLRMFLAAAPGKHSNVGEEAFKNLVSTVIHSSVSHLYVVCILPTPLASEALSTLAALSNKNCATAGCAASCARAPPQKLTIFTMRNFTHIALPMPRISLWVGTVVPSMSDFNRQCLPWTQGIRAIHILIKRKVRT